MELPGTASQIDVQGRSMALVLADKRSEVRRFFDEDTKSMKMKEWEPPVSSWSEAAWDAGAAAADRAILSAPKGLPGVRGELE
jgi:hypothetical protein